MKLTCSICEGEGGWIEWINPEIGGPYTQCYVCAGEGTVSVWKRLNMWFWEHPKLGRLQDWYIMYYDWRHPRNDWGWKDGKPIDEDIYNV